MAGRSMIARFSLLSIAGAAAFLFFSTGGRADPIGDVVSVVPAANYQRGGAVQELRLNGLVEQNDHVITVGDGSAYIHFIDDTVLTVGANSEVVLDKFIFDGDRAKTATVQLVRGTLRFVTGISDHRAYQIQTPVATIGVRGTTIDMSYEDDRMVYHTVEGVGHVCHVNVGCRDIGADSEPIALTRGGGFVRATAAEIGRMQNVINRSHGALAQRIGRTPGSMLAFARSRGPRLSRGQRGQRELQKGLDQRGQKGFEQRGQKAFGPKDFGMRNLKGENPRFNVKKRDEKKRPKDKRF